MLRDQATSSLDQGVLFDCILNWIGYYLDFARIAESFYTWRLLIRQTSDVSVDLVNALKHAQFYYPSFIMTEHGSCLSLCNTWNLLITPTRLHLLLKPYLAGNKYAKQSTSDSTNYLSCTDGMFLYVFSGQKEAIPLIKRSDTETFTSQIRTLISICSGRKYWLSREEYISL